MAKRHGVKHRTTGVWLAVWPSLAPVDVAPDYRTTPDPAEAVSSRTWEQTEAERLGLDSFADAWVVEKVEQEMPSDE